MKTKKMVKIFCAAAVLTLALSAVSAFAIYDPNAPVSNDDGQVRILMAPADDAAIKDEGKGDATGSGKEDIKGEGETGNIGGNTAPDQAPDDKAIVKEETQGSAEEGDKILVATDTAEDAKADTPTIMSQVLKYTPFAIGGILIIIVLYIVFKRK